MGLSAFLYLHCSWVYTKGPRSLQLWTHTTGLDNLQHTELGLEVSAPTEDYFYLHSLFA